MLKRNNFSSHNFECGCPESIASQWNAHVNSHGNLATQPPKPETTSAVEFPLFQLTTEEDENEGTDVSCRTSDPSFLERFRNLASSFKPSRKFNLDSISEDPYVNSINAIPSNVYRDESSMFTLQLPKQWDMYRGYELESTFL